MSIVLRHMSIESLGDKEENGVKIKGLSVKLMKLWALFMGTFVVAGSRIN